MKVWIGYEPREKAAFAVAAKTAARYGCQVEPLYEDRLRKSGLLTRPMDTRGGMWDFNSSAPQATSFAVARFWVFLLTHSGWAMFVDCDVLFLADPHQLLDLCDESKAVMVVKHGAFKSGREIAHHDAKEVYLNTKTKMDNQPQTTYPRKLWSSVMLINADHSANQRLNLTTLNQWPGRDLHAFKWLADDEIGELPPEANWLVGIQPKPAAPMIAHYTLGTPDMVEDCEHADLWLAEREHV